ncbi:phosphonate ABC transporter ATP-binding protein [Dolosicoccus paucivorans]|uniref:phosphonate ABC transporter ATP-binding protein n=1 Tax=Dolosicoccus paucivorans TaxID=84521 RepID=UPI00087E3C12|nr:ATP-binding cassette domain-containing protein [Dolosicoccus paucivorans]SDI65871.1 phosphonate transport system ATP-binding protein [Dolosicoccus paucivorans]
MVEQPLLTVEHIFKYHGKLLAVDDVSFTVFPGEKVALIGSSGSGKTTLLNLLVKLSHPTKGSIYLKDRPIQSIPSAKEYAQWVGLLPQQFNLIPTLSVLHNVLVGRMNQWGTAKALWSLLVPQERKIASAALSKVGLSDKETTLVQHLSGGQQQRIAIARLLMQNPQLVLADEPVASLDPANARQILELLTQVTDPTQTLIASIHSTDLALTYFDRIIGLKEGRLVFDTSCQQVTQEMLDHLYQGG